MIENDEFKAALVGNLQHMRAFAHLLAKNSATADDLVQETLMRALAKRHLFTPGTNLKGWLIIIMRNCFFNMMRKSSRTAEVSVDYLDEMRATDGGQDTAIEMRDFKAALNRLPHDQQEALILVAASGYSYDEAAEILHCPAGTVKSRVSRARAELENQLHGVERPEMWLKQIA